MLHLLPPLLVAQTRSLNVPAPPHTPARDHRYRWGNSNQASVMVNGKPIPGRAIIRDNRIQVPMRPIFEALGANVEWYPRNRKVVAMGMGREISLVLDENMAYTPEAVTLDYPPRMVRGVVYVPLRFVAQSLGAQVGFDSKGKVARIETSRTLTSSG